MFRCKIVEQFIIENLFRITKVKRTLKCLSDLPDLK